MAERLIYNNFLYLYGKKFLKIKPIGRISFVYNIVLYNDLPQNVQQKFSHLVGSSIKGNDGVYRERKIIKVEKYQYKVSGNAEYRKEYRETHKEQIKKYSKEYRETHKEQQKENCKKWKENNKEKVKKYRKEYNEAHKEQRKEKNKKRRENNKEKIETIVVCVDKRCSGCMKIKLLSAFYNNITKKDGKGNRCIECLKKYNKEYRETHKEYNKEYNETHKEQIRERKKEHYENHKEQIKKQAKEYYETHKEERKEYNKEYKKTLKKRLETK